MRILITNDDGMQASQLIPLIKWCQKLGQVVTYVPKDEQSGKSHGIELHTHFEAKQVELEPGITVWAVDSTPADCVRFAVLGMHEKIDLVISGINRGLNIGTDTVYSGTIGAACEAVALGIPAIAISTPPKFYESAVAHLDRVYQFFIDHRLMERNNIYNVNIPADPKEILITRQGGRYYSDDFVPMGNDQYLPKGKCVYESSHDLTLDTDAAMNGYISISPLTINKTNMDVFQELRKINP